MKTSFALALASLTSAQAGFLLESTITARNDTLAAGSIFIVDYALANVGNEAVTVLTYDTPLEDTIRSPFLMVGGDVESEYTGIMVKRVAETELSAFVTLQPGQAISEEIDLNKYHAFYSNGDAHMSAVSSFRVSPPGMKSAPSIFSMDSVNVESNSLTVSVQKAVPKADTVDPGFSIQAISYNGCSNSEQSTTNTAISNAKTMMSLATSVLNSGSTSSYKTWVENSNSVTSSRYNTFRSDMSSIQSEFSRESYSVDCTCNDNYYAYVYPSDRSHTIYVCRAYWTAPTGSYQIDSKPGTLIHELSHFNDVAGTNDYAYGQTACRNLAISNPSRAAKNADNHEYFCETRPN